MGQIELKINEIQNDSNETNVLYVGRSFVLPGRLRVSMLSCLSRRILFLPSGPFIMLSVNAAKQPNGEDLVDFPNLDCPISCAKEPHY